MMSTVEAILARTAGGRSRLLVTMNPQSQAGCLRRQSCEQRPGFECGAVHVASERDHVIPEPSVLEYRDGIGVEPHPEDVVVRHVRLAGLDAEGHPSSLLGGHDVLLGLRSGMVSEPRGVEMGGRVLRRARGRDAFAVPPLTLAGG